jgi:hypothetical protein
MAHAAIQAIASNTAIYGVFATKSAQRVIPGATIKIIDALCSCKLNITAFDDDPFPLSSSSGVKIS